MSKRNKLSIYLLKSGIERPEEVFKNSERIRLLY